MFMHLFIDARGIIINEMDAHIREYIYVCVCVCVCACVISAEIGGSSFIQVIFR